MKDDAKLLKELAEEGSEDAFAELVRRQIDLVYSAARRQLGGDEHLARDAAQATFSALARKASELRGHQSMSGWLYNTARFIAARMRRTETRRGARDAAFSREVPTEAETERAWRELEPVLDDAMQVLGEKDREAVILRYFQNETFARVGAALGANENAARMRVERALRKLRAVLERRGIRKSSEVVGAALAAKAVSAAPAGLAAIITSPALAAAGAGAASGTLAIGFMSMVNVKTAVAGLALAGAATGWVMNHQEADRLKAKLVEFQKPPDATARIEPGRLMVDEAEWERLRAGNSELMRLRAEVTRLKAELRNVAKVAAAVPSAQAEPVKPEILEAQWKEAARMLGIAKLTSAKSWGMAFHKFAAQNQGRMPTNLQEAEPFLPPIPPEMEWVDMIAGGDFEILFHGYLREIENPGSAIILRDRQLFNIKDDGSADRTYLFADGHTEVHRAPDGNFEAWEGERQPRLKEPQNALGLVRER